MKSNGPGSGLPPVNIGGSGGGLPNPSQHIVSKVASAAQAHHQSMMQQSHKVQASKIKATVAAHKGHS